MIDIAISCEGAKVGISATERGVVGVELHVHVVADNIVDAVTNLVLRFESAQKEVYERLKQLGIVNEPKPEGLAS